MNDVIDSLRELRTESPLDESFVGRAKNDFLRDIDRRPSSRSIFPARRWVAVVLAGAACAAAVLVFALPGAEVTQQATAADLRNVANVAAAADPPPARLGRGQYVLTRYTYIASSTITLTQDRLDRLSRDQYRRLTRRQMGHYLRVDPQGTPQSKIDQAERMQRAFEQRVKRGVKLSDLPAKTVTTKQSQPFVSWINERHIGAGGGRPGGEATYGSADQRATVKRLDRAGIFTNPTVLHVATTFSEANQLEDFTWPSAEIAKLPAEAKAMEAALRRKPVPLSRPGDRHRIDGDSELFHAAIGLLRSPFATPEQRSAIVLMLGDLDGVTIESDAGDAGGRHGLGLKLATKYGSQQVIFDQSSSQVLGVNFAIDRPVVLAGEMAPYLEFADSAFFGVVYQPTIIVRGRPTCPVDIGSGMRGEEYCEKHVRPVTSQNTTG